MLPRLICSYSVLAVRGGERMTAVVHIEQSNLWVWLCASGLWCSSGVCDVGTGRCHKLPGLLVPPRHPRHPRPRRTRGHRRPGTYPTRRSRRAALFERCVTVDSARRRSERAAGDAAMALGGGRMDQSTRIGVRRCFRRLLVPRPRCRRTHLRAPCRTPVRTRFPRGP